MGWMDCGMVVMRGCGLVFGGEGGGGVVGLGVHRVSEIVMVGQLGGAGLGVGEGDAGAHVLWRDSDFIPE